MSEIFAISGENGDSTSGPAPQLQGVFLPGVDDSQFVDGFGVVTPWGGSSTARRYGDYGISTDRETQLVDLSRGLISAGGVYDFEGIEGPQGIQGIPGRDGLPGVITVMGLNLPQNTNYLTDLPHNIDSINDLGTAANKLIYTNAYVVEDEISDEDLCSGTTDGDTLPEYGDTPGWEEREVTFSSSVELTSGTKYAIVVNAASREGDAELYWSTRTDNPYANGDRYGSSDSGVSWTVDEDDDVWFKTKAEAVEKDDGSFNPDGFDSAEEIYGVNWSAQIFTASSTYTISSIILKLAKYTTWGGTVETVTASIRRVESYSEATWAEADLTSAGRALLDDTTTAAQRTTIGAGTGDSPTFTGLTLSGISVAVTDVDKFLVDSMGIIKYRTGVQVLSDIGGQALDDVLTDLAALTAVADNEFIVGTGAGVYAHESGATARTSLGVDAAGTASGLISTHESTYNHGNYNTAYTHSQASSGNPHSVTPTELSLVIGTNTQAWDAGLDSLAGLGYVSDSMIKITAEDTYAVRTMAQVLSDIGAAASGHNHDATYQPLDAELTSLAALSYVAASFVKMTGANTFALRTLQQTSDDLEATIDHNNLLNYAANQHYLQSAITTVGTLTSGAVGVGFTSISTTYTDAKCTNALADQTSANETSHTDVVVDGDFTSNGLLNRTGAGTYSIKAIGTDVQAHGEVLDDLNTLGTVGANSEFLVGTAAGALAWENAATAKASIGLGNVENTKLSTWAGTTNITTLGTIATIGNVTVADGGTIRCVGTPILTFNDTGNILGITGAGLRVGIGTNAPSALLELAASGTNSQAKQVFSTFNDQTGYYCSIFMFRKSHSDTLGTLTETIDNEVLGRLEFRGVNNISHDKYGGEIDIVQDGAVGAFVPCNMCLNTHSSTAKNTNQLVLYHDGGIYMHTLKSGTDQANAGAATNELYHDTADNTIKIGV